MTPLLTLVLGAGLLGAHVQEPNGQAGQEPPVVRRAVCRWAKTAPRIDGKADDPAWADAPVLEHFPAFWAGQDTRSKTLTQARLLWDDQALYLFAAMTDKELRAFGTTRNAKLWNGDVFEMFLKPKADAKPYYEFQFNPHGALLELAIPGMPFDFDKVAAEPPSGIQVAVQVQGTLDRPGDTDESWSVEVRIPWSRFAPTGGRPSAGDCWRFALCRYDYGPEGTEPLLMSSAPLRKPSFHATEDYGILSFEGPAR